MRAWHILRSRLRSLLLRGSREADLREELQLHLEREAERLEAGGLSRDEARLQARRLFGGVEQIKEESRDARGTAALDTLGRDTRYGLRRLVRDWRFTSAAVLILGLSIGVNTAIFSVVNAVLFRDQGFAEPDRLVNIYQNDRAGRPMIVTSDAAYHEMAGAPGIFSATLAATIPEPARYLDQGAVRSAVVQWATASYLDTLGLRPSLGRWFDETEDRPGSPIVAVLGHQAWTRRFRSDVSVIGRVIRMEGLPVTIIGVGPANHRGTIDVGLATEFWLPLSAVKAMAPVPARRESPMIIAPMFVKGRLRDDVSLPRAQAAMDVAGQRIAAEYPELFKTEGEFALGAGVTVVPSEDVRVHPQADKPFMAIASVVIVTVGLVLAIACSNLATLLLVRGATRAKEISVRLAMGATRRQLVRHLLTESLLLALAGGGAGCVLAWWAMQGLLRAELPITVDLTLDYRVLAFALALSLVMGVIFGLTPALKATRIDLLSTLRDEGQQPLDHRRLTLKNALIVFQVAISVFLLGGTNVFLQMAAAARDVRPGFAVDGVAILETDVRFAGHSESESRAVYDELLRRVEAIPGVEAAALLRGGPMQANSVPVVIDGGTGQSDASVEATLIGAAPGFFDTLRIPILYGRVFDARDRLDTPRVAVVTERMARQYFGDVNAVGRRFRPANDETAWTEVIGVVPDTGTGSLDNDVLDPIAPVFFTSYTQSGSLPTTVIARSSREAAPLVLAMQRELRAVDITLPVVRATTMAQDLEREQAPPRAIATLLAALAGLGLGLASIGLYAVVSFAVARRTREIGMRIALGARGRQVVWGIARGVAGLIAAGTGVGLALAVLLMLVMRAGSGSADIGIGSMTVYRPDIDPMALLAIAAIAIAVGAAAAFVPGRRAARLDPLVALRHE